MDALSDILRALRLTGGVFLQADFSEPWCLHARVLPADCGSALPADADIIPYHYVLEGNLRVQLRGQSPFELSAGQVVLFPRNDEHLLGGDLSLPPARQLVVMEASGADAVATLCLGGGGLHTRVICGFLAARDLKRNLFVQSLPAVLYLDMRGGAAAAWVRSSFQYAAWELRRGGAGSQTVLAKLSELLFIEAVRRYVETVPEQQTGLLAGLKDVHVGRALALLHDKPAQAWTVDKLGRDVGLCRSALADRFVQLLGLPPIQYLTQLRMQRARHALEESQASLAQIAEFVGYDSEAAFSRAFKRVVGRSPGAFRKAAQHGAARCPARGARSMK